MILAPIFIIAMLIISGGSAAVEMTTTTGTSSSSSTEINPVLLTKLAVFPDYKYLFCLIEKVANTAFAEVLQPIPFSGSAIVRRENALWSKHN